MNLKGRNVFLSGPMSNIKNFNVEGFAAAHHKAKEAGAKEVYDPAVEYLTKGSAEDSHQECMRRTIHELTKSLCKRSVDGTTTYKDQRHYDAIVMLPGWESSLGARLELDVATACGIEVVMLQDVEPLSDEPTIVSEADGARSVKIPASWLSVTSCYCDEEKE